MAMIYSFGEISGAHFNPAVTIAFAYAKKFSWKEVPKYIIAQLLGAILASCILWILFPASEYYGATIPSFEPWRAFVLELLLTFFLMLTIINVSSGSKEVGVMAGIANIYAKLGAGLDVSILKDKNYYLEGNKFIDEVNFSQGGVIKVTGEAGLKVGAGIKNDEGKMILGIEGGGKIDITGGGKIIYPYNGNEEIIAGEAYLNTLMYTFTATAKLGPLDKEFKFSDILWGIRYKKTIKFNVKTGNKL